MNNERRPADLLLNAPQRLYEYSKWLAIKLCGSNMSVPNREVGRPDADEWIAISEKVYCPEVVPIRGDRLDH